MEPKDKKSVEKIEDVDSGMPNNIPELEPKDKKSVEQSEADIGDMPSAKQDLQQKVNKSGKKYETGEGDTSSTTKDEKEQAKTSDVKRQAKDDGIPETVEDIKQDDKNSDEKCETGNGDTPNSTKDMKQKAKKCNVKRKAKNDGIFKSIKDLAQNNKKCRVKHKAVDDGMPKTLKDFAQNDQTSGTKYIDEEEYITKNMKIVKQNGKICKCANKSKRKHASDLIPIIGPEYFTLPNVGGENVPSKFKDVQTKYQRKYEIDLVQAHRELIRELCIPRTAFRPLRVQKIYVEETDEFIYKYKPLIFAQDYVRKHRPKYVSFQRELDARVKAAYFERSLEFKNELNRINYKRNCFLYCSLVPPIIGALGWFFW